ncbi:MAG: hypothetical protein WC506_03915 [Candidatus Micrarchaeia archaeon]
MQVGRITSPVGQIMAYQKIQNSTRSRGTVTMAKPKSNPVAIITISREGYEKYKLMLGKNTQEKPVPKSEGTPWNMTPEIDGIRKGDIITALQASKSQAEVATVLAPIVNTMARATTSVLLGNEGDISDLSEKYSKMHTKLETGVKAQDSKTALAGGAEKLVTSMVSVSKAIKESLNAMAGNNDPAAHKTRLARISSRLFEFLDYSGAALRSEEA